MITNLNLSIRAATVADRQKLANLMHFEVYVHRHLDWRPPLEWLGEEPYLVAEQRGVIVAALACPPDPPNVAWIRLFAASSSISPQRAWHTLWPEAAEQVSRMERVEWVAGIPLQSWFEGLLEESHFIHTHNVVMLSWDRSHKLPAERPAPVTIRPMTLDDLPLVEKVDEASFVPVWQNSQPCLEIAFRQAAVATVAEDAGRIVAYQISTGTALGGHLARLAVHPSYQGKGIGFCLVRDMLGQFERRGAQSVTVNTQQDNEASLSLYRKVGFHLTGEEFPIYQYEPR